MQDLATNRTKQKDYIPRRGFYSHLAVYGAVNTLLIVINLTSNNDQMWFVWPLFGWGIGIIVHAIYSFTLNSDVD